jgi:arsenate reductase
MSDFPVTVYHNPNCATSRNVVSAVREAGYEPIVVEYLKTGWTETRLRDLATRSGEGLRGLLRDRGAPAAELGLLAEGASDEVLLAAMLEHPILVNRPIVETPRGVVLARPSERVFEVLDRRPETFKKEDGQVV